MEQQNNFGNLRNYVNSARKEIVEKTYQNMQINQSLAFVKAKKDKYYQLNHGKMNVFEVFKLLETMVDDSDPDNDLPQVFHAYQTAESIFQYAMENATQLKNNLSIRDLFRDHEWQAVPPKWQTIYSQNTIATLYDHIKDWSWLPVVGFVHDLGKVMALEHFGKLPQWCVVGDTFPVAAPFSKSNVFYGKGFYKDSEDFNKYNVENNEYYGVYHKHCGFDNVDMSWGHDEYIYEVMRKGSTIVKEGLYLLRFHSFYPWHTPQNGSLGYIELASEYDWKMLPLVKAFQKGDLYSKSTVIPTMEQIEQKYKPLLAKYIPSPSIDW
ncbi:MAG: hypothetical protein RL017_777 [Pseudomonadota bacterium]|jgi:inositol oxygenase|nr:hypothetical protein [Burkholderiales bacterium]